MSPDLSLARGMSLALLCKVGYTGAENFPGAWLRTRIRNSAASVGHYVIGAGRTDLGCESLAITRSII